MNPCLNWFGIVRLGLVQAALGAIVVLTTSTMNRVMVVELALPAVLPGALVALHYTIQLLRPRLGYGSDLGQRRTPWIIGGMIVLACGGIGCALAIAAMASHLVTGLLLAVASFVLIGVGVGAAGTSLIVLLATHVESARRPAAATIVWVMMICGFVLTTALAGHFLEPFSLRRLVVVTAATGALAVAVTLLAIFRLEPYGRPQPAAQRAQRTPFRAAFSQVWREPEARLFTFFIVISMLGYSAQDLILEPFAGLVFDYSPGQSTKLASIQHGGVLIGMVSVGLLGTLKGVRRWISMQTWVVGGCVASAVALGALALLGLAGGTQQSLPTTVFALGVANGVYAVSAIGAMMSLAGHGRARREGVRMGLWGAAQAIAMGAGGLLGAAAVDLVGLFTAAPAFAYGLVFLVEAGLFVVASVMALRIAVDGRSNQPVAMINASEQLVGVSQR